MRARALWCTPFEVEHGPVAEVNVPLRLMHKLSFRFCRFRALASLSCRFLIQSI